jgi:outer membrane porin protein LC
MNGFGVGATYAKSDRTDRQVAAGRVANTVNAGGENAEVWAAGLKYDANNIYLATTYSETRNMTNFGDGYIANKAQNFEVVAQYQFDFGLRPSIAYLKSKGKDWVHTATRIWLNTLTLARLLLQQKHVYLC